jgi:S-adenosylmethionine synthetase
VTGLITPFRSASLEAAAGKNPISHVGKVYNVLALITAGYHRARADDQRGADLYSQPVGKPLDQPLIATASLRAVSGALTPSVQADVQAVMDENLANIARVRTILANREITLYQARYSGQRIS